MWPGLSVSSVEFMLSQMYETLDPQWVLAYAPLPVCESSDGGGDGFCTEHHVCVCFVMFNYLWV